VKPSLKLAEAHRATASRLSTSPHMLSAIWNSFGWKPEGRGRHVVSAAAQPSGPSRLTVTNSSPLPVEVYINGNGPFLRCDAKKTHTVDLPRGQLQGQLSWTASHKMHGEHDVSLASGYLAACESRMRCQITVKENALTTEVVTRLGMPLACYSLLVNAQVRCRKRVRAKAAAECLRRRTAAVLVQSSFRSHLKRTMRTCFICFDRVAWASMISIVPDQNCHKTCKDCATAHVNHALEEGKLYVRCPGEGCKHLLSDPQVEALASRKALDMKQKNQRAANARRLGEWEQEDDGFKDFCSRHARKCPACSVIIYRHAGCDHMHCRCGAHFDWNKTPGIFLSDKTGKTAREQPAAGEPHHRRRRNGHVSAAQRLEGFDALVEELEADGDWMPRRPGNRAEEQAHLQAAIAASLD